MRGGKGRVEIVCSIKISKIQTYCNGSPAPRYSSSISFSGVFAVLYLHPTALDFDPRDFATQISHRATPIFLYLWVRALNCPAQPATSLGSPPTCIRALRDSKLRSSLGEIVLYLALRLGKAYTLGNFCRATHKKSSILHYRTIIWRFQRRWHRQFALTPS